MVPDARPTTGSASAKRPPLAALNETLRDDYVADCRKGVDRWNRTLADGRSRAVAAARRVQSGRRDVQRPAGQPRRASASSEAEWQASVGEWLPTDDDRAFVESLMVGVHEPGKMAGWLAPPSTGIHAKPVDFEYVKI